MKIILAPDSFKDTLPAKTVAGILSKKAKEIFPNCETIEIPLADGDKGTIDTLISVLGGSYGKTTVRNYLGKDTEVIYGILDRETAVMEARHLLWDESTEYSIRQKMLFSSSYGVGELIRYLLDRGFKKIYIGAGKSIANDGGMGLAKALGVRFLNKKKEEVEAIGANLKEIAEIDISGLDPRLKEVEMIVMCAVNNALLGDQGATYLYGALNGGGPEELICLEHGMKNYAALVEKKMGTSIITSTGAGASGGIPAALKAFCGARLQSGISTMLYLIGFEKLIDDASLVVVGEGLMDRTSIYGKAVTGIGMACKAKGIPVVALVGKIGREAEAIYHFGIDSVISSVTDVMDHSEFIEDAEILIENASERLFRFLAVGMQIQYKENGNPKKDIHLRKEHTGNKSFHWAFESNWEEF